MQKPNPIIARGLKYAQWGGYLFSFLLLILAFLQWKELSVDASLYAYFKLVYFFVLALILRLPVAKLSSLIWKLSFAATVLLSIGFVFLMIVDVMFAYMAAAERGERLGVPGFEGTLIFLCLLQVPTLLFVRNPELLDAWSHDPSL